MTILANGVWQKNSETERKERAREQDIYDTRRTDASTHEEARGLFMLALGV